MQPRTKRQREVLDYITNFIEDKGYEPSYQQIARYFKIASKSAIAKHIAALETQGLLSRQRENGSFGLQIRPKETFTESVYEIEWLKMPFKDDFFNDFENETLFVPQFMIGNLLPDRVCAFLVRDDAMINDHIYEGDIALVEQRPYARDGDIIVAFVEKKRVILNKYYRDGANIELRPNNDDFQSFFVSAEKISIQGVVRGLLRPFN
jgi:repressor LexA